MLRLTGKSVRLPRVRVRVRDMRCVMRREIHAGRWPAERHLIEFDLTTGTERVRSALAPTLACQCRTNGSRSKNKLKARQSRAQLQLQPENQRQSAVETKVETEAGPTFYCSTPQTQTHLNPHPHPSSIARVWAEAASCLHHKKSK